ncbi:glycosyltransferase family 4 protein [Brevibacillus daliensis]|uniref:glycosyltransferase family 4 protein n=1 Tax=Brevibacillus daliensis TaxID=2892995 RepID=UPI001E533EC9|nr:glycosyltransferase family 4 protein [Brevibacillus daliensis]
MNRKVAHICTSQLSYKILEEKLIQLSSQYGYEIHLISSEEGQDSGAFRKNGLQQHYVPMKRSIHPWEDFKSIYQMSRLIKREKFDIVHTHTAKAGIIGRIAATISKVPLIIHTSHGLPFYDGQPFWQHQLYKAIEIMASTCCHYVASQNQEDLQKLAKYIRADKLIYEGNGVDVAEIDRCDHFTTDEFIHEVKAKYGIPNDKKIILMGARFEPVKDHFLLLKCLRLLKEQGTEPFCCLLAGNGLLEEEIKRSVIENELEEEVIFLGYQADMFPWFKMADLLMLTSQKEGIPRFLMEGMAMSKAVVATDVLGTKELVVHNQTGLLSRYGDANALAFAVKRLLESPEVNREFGIAGRQRIEEQFSLEAVLKRMHELYQRQKYQVKATYEQV